MQPEMTERANGDKFWWLNGKLHREDGPALESANGDKHWCLNGLLHREDGPAVECANGSKEWWLNDEEADQLVFWLTTKERIKM